MPLHKLAGAGRDEGLSEFWASSSFARLAGGRAKILRERILEDESFEVKILILAMCVKCNEAVSVFLEQGTEMDVNGARRKLQHAKQHDLIHARRYLFTILAQFLSSLLSLTTEFRYSELIRRTVYDFKQRCLCESQCDHIDHIVRVPFSVVC